MPRKGGKSVSPTKRKEKEATYGVETSSHVEEDHDNVSRASHEAIRPMDDGGASDKGDISLLLNSVDSFSSSDENFAALGYVWH